MAVTTAPFFDPGLAQLQRQLLHQQTTGVADLRLKGQRLQEDQNLFRPYMERRFGQQMEKTSASAAQRGFHGESGSGVLRGLLADVGEEQAFARGQYERKATRGMEDVERAIANLTSGTIRQGAEGVRSGAGRASERAYPEYLNLF